MCEFDWGTFWNAVGALATFFAAVVALILPQRMEKRAQARLDAERDRNRISAIIEILSAVEQALDQYFRLRSLIEQDDPNPHHARAISIAATNTKLVLGVICRRPELTDGAVTAGVAAERLASNVEVIGQQASGAVSAMAVAASELGRVHGIALSAYEQGKAVAEFHHINDRAKGFAGFDKRFEDLRHLP